MITVFLKIISHPIILVLFSAFTFLILVLFLPENKMRSFFVTTASVLLMFSIINAFLGHHLLGRLINEYGVQGTGVVISVEGTNFTYNDQPVIRHNVLLRTDLGETVETHFLSSDFNFYPVPNAGYHYPSIWENFSVKYMEDDPNLFIILTESVSDGYSNGAVCNEVVYQLNEAMAKLKFDPQNELFQDDFELVLLQYEREDCYTNQATLEYYQTTFRRLNIE